MAYAIQLPPMTQEPPSNFGGPETNLLKLRHPASGASRKLSHHALYISLKWPKMHFRTFPAVKMLARLQILYDNFREHLKYDQKLCRVKTLFDAISALFA